MLQEADIMNEIKENGPVQGENISLRLLIRLYFSTSSYPAIPASEQLQK